MTPFNIFRKETEDEEQLPNANEAETQEEPREEKRGLFQKLRDGLQKTRSKVTGGLRGVLSMHRTLDDELLEEIEEQLYIADVGPRTVMRIREALESAYKDKEIESPDDVLDFLRDHLKQELRDWDAEVVLPQGELGVIMVAGVNGSGKTTTIAKIAHRYVSEGRRVLLAACDTFRAAAIEQLTIWADRVGADIVKNESADPAAVAFDGADKALAGDYDVLIIDTAGRLHTRSNLMMELQKIGRVVGKKVPGAPHETLIVLDATTGQNAISQAIRFNESIDLTGIVLAKLDGTAKGGVIFGIKDQLDVPVKFVGVGETPGDLMRFDPDQFVEAMFE